MSATKRHILSDREPPAKKARRETGEKPLVFSEGKLDIPGGDVYYFPEVVDQLTSKEWFGELDNLDIWYHPTLKVYGKEVTQSRSVAAYLTSKDITVNYSGHKVSLNYANPEILSRIQSIVEAYLGTTFNHVLLNRYTTGDEYIGRHRDTKENKIIASLSLGAERTFILTPNRKCPGKPSRRSLRLQNGSLLVMQGDTQDNWKHEIPKEPNIRESRISLTFRQVEMG